MDQKLTIEYFNKKFTHMDTRLQSLIEINDRLIKQNLYLSGKLYGTNDDKSPKSPKNEKQLFYEIKEIGNLILISGSGTFDAKDKLKEIHCEWDKNIKSWKSHKSEEEIKQLFPDIIKKT